MKLISSLIIALFMAGQASAKANLKNSAQAQKDKVTARALAENALFKCSAQKSFDSNVTGEKLDAQLKKACANEIKTLSKWYKPKDQMKMANKLIANGKRSALANQKNL